MNGFAISFCLLLVLLGAGKLYPNFIPGVGTAHAAGYTEPVYPPYCWQQSPVNKLWYPCGSEEVKLAHCVNLMETAMTKVDPYLKFLKTGIPKFTPEEKDKYDRALYAWNRIKHECWKEFEEERMRPDHIH